MALAEGRASARSALVGNPSDGYGGMVMSVELPTLEARAWVTDGVGPGDGFGPDGLQAIDSALIAATVARFARQFDRSADVRVKWQTQIPQSVGLAGSSAIVIAVARALCALNGVEVSPGELAAFAHAVERIDLSIPGGMQDSYVQAHGGLVNMDFSGEVVVAEALDPALLPPLLVAWRTAGAENSGIVHRDLRARYEARDPLVIETMATLQHTAEAARAALLSGDRGVFARAVDDTFDLRRRIMTLDPRHVEMVEIARGAGAAANYTGSGGAIVAVCEDGGHRERVARALESVACTTQVV